METFEHLRKWMLTRMTRLSLYIILRLFFKILFFFRVIIRKRTSWIIFIGWFYYFLLYFVFAFFSEVSGENNFYPIWKQNQSLLLKNKYTGILSWVLYHENSWWFCHCKTSLLSSNICRQTPGHCRILFLPIVLLILLHIFNVFYQ